MDFPSMKIETERHINHPEVGDHFTEHYCFHIFVLDVTNGEIKTIEASAPCSLPDDGMVKKMSLQEFRERFSYGSIKGYWVVFIDNEWDEVKTWM